MNRFFQALAIGSTCLATLVVLIPQIRNPHTLNADTVWFEVSPLLTVIAQATGAPVNMAMAEKITRDAVQTIKDAANAPVG